MEKQVSFTGICAKTGHERTIKISYVFNGFEWEKGIGECPVPCNHECPIIELAPDIIQKL